MVIGPVKKTKARKGKRESREQEMAFTLNRMVKECFTD